jgi:hypothetical protein
VTRPTRRVDQLVARVPATVRAQLADTLATLATLGPVVEDALGRITPLVDAAEGAVELFADPAQAELGPPTDAEWGAVIDRLGIGLLYTWAGRLAAAHPERAQGVR